MSIIKIENHKNIIPTKMKYHYSQWNQDYNIYKIIKDEMECNPRIPNRDLVCIDIGAGNGLKYSNSLLFESLGWICYCIEAVPDVFEKLVKNRKKSICIKTAIFDRELKEIDFMACAGHTERLSGIKECFNKNHLAKIKNEISEFGGYAPIIKLSTQRLDNILKQYDIPIIDYLSINVEGAEMNVLRSIDFNKVHINTISIEINYTEDEFEIKDYLRVAGFKPLGWCGADIIFQNNFITK